MDPRVDKLANLLASYSLEVRSGDRVLMHGDVATLPLVRAFYAQVVKLGGLPELMVEDQHCYEALLRHASDEQLLTPSPILPPSGGDRSGLPHHLGEREHPLP